MQTLNTLSTPEEKLTALCKKYAELVREDRTLKNKKCIAIKFPT